MKTGSFGCSPSRFASMKWPISWMRIRSTTPIANFQPQMSAYAATAMKIDENLTRTNENFASAIDAGDDRAGEPREPLAPVRAAGWIGS